MELIQWVHDVVRAKWDSWAWKAGKTLEKHAGHPVGFAGKAFYFVVSSDYNNWFVMPSVGEHLYDARGRLEATLRCLGVNRLMEREAGDLQFRIGFPRCPVCGELMTMQRRHLFGKLASWRCGLRGCGGRIWTYVPMGHRGPQSPDVLGAGTVMDMAESYGHKKPWEG